MKLTVKEYIGARFKIIENAHMKVTNKNDCKVVERTLDFKDISSYMTYAQTMIEDGRYVELYDGEKLVASSVSYATFLNKDTIEGIRNKITNQRNIGAFLDYLSNH